MSKGLRNVSHAVQELRKLLGFGFRIQPHYDRWLVTDDDYPDIEEIWTSRDVYKLVRKLRSDQSNFTNYIQKFENRVRRKRVRQYIKTEQFDKIPTRGKVKDVRPALW